MGESVFAAVLCLATDLRSLRLYCPGYTGPCWPKKTSEYEQLNNFLRTVITSTGSSVESQPLGKLHSLYLVADTKPEYSKEFSTLHKRRPWWSDLDICPILLEAPNLSHIHTTMLVTKSGNISKVPRRLKCFTACRRLRLRPEDINALLSMPHLEVLELYDIDSKKWATLSCDQDYLNSQLAAHASKKLKRLAI
ncbi:hypothetical protein F5B20DRAFT_533405, partial [Whalleya microplaca]